MIDSTGGRTREKEWYVPRFGPRRFRLFVGMTFYPYTAMNVSYAVIGSLLSPASVNWERLGAVALIYALSVGVSAHALDAMGPNRPWGQVLSDRQLLGLAASSLVAASLIGLYFAFTGVPLLILVGLPEIFFLFAYNLELFGGFFHTPAWFCVSWGLLPVVAGYVIQTNTVGLPVLLGGAFGFATAFGEITTSKKYKSLKRDVSLSPVGQAEHFETVLKVLVGGVVLVMAALVVFRSL